MTILKLEEYGQWSAIQGLLLSYNTTREKALEASYRLAPKDGGHNKFLESIMTWWQIEAPRYWWQQFDTYRAGVTKQSESTMHTIMRNPLSQDNFEKTIPQETLDRLNYLILNKQFDQLKVELPEGFLQARVVCMSYKVLRAMIGQRLNHKLSEWSKFCNEVFDKVNEKDYLKDLMEKKE